MLVSWNSCVLQIWGGVRHFLSLQKGKTLKWATWCVTLSMKNTVYQYTIIFLYKSNYIRTSNLNLSLKTILYAEMELKSQLFLIVLCKPQKRIFVLGKNVEAGNPADLFLPSCFAAKASNHFLGERAKDITGRRSSMASWYRHLFSR